MAGALIPTPEEQHPNNTAQAVAANVSPDSRREMKSDRPQDSPLLVTTMLAKGTSPRGRSRRTKPERGRETGTINTGFVASQLPSYVTVPLLVAAEALGISGTTLKRLCRQHGIKRWPYRRIVGIDRTIRQLESRLVSSRAKTEEDIARVKAEIMALRERRRIAIERFNQETSFLAAAERLASAGNLDPPCSPQDDDLSPAGIPRMSGSANSSHAAGVCAGETLPLAPSPSRPGHKICTSAGVPIKVPLRSASTSPAAVPVHPSLPTSMQMFGEEPGSILGVTKEASCRSLESTMPLTGNLCPCPSHDEMDSVGTISLGLATPGHMASFSSPSRVSSTMSSHGFPVAVPKRSDSTSPTAVPLNAPKLSSAARVTPEAPPPDQRYPPPSITLPRLAQLDQSERSPSDFTDGGCGVFQLPMSRAAETVHPCLEIDMGTTDDDILSTKSSEHNSSPTGLDLDSSTDCGTPTTTADDVWLPDSASLASPSSGVSGASSGAAIAIGESDYGHNWGTSSSSSMAFTEDAETVDESGQVSDMTVEDFQVLHQLLLGCDINAEKASLGLRQRDFGSVRGMYGVDVNEILMHASNNSSTRK